MKQVSGWWMPDHEAHLGPWMETPKNKLIMNGRQAYQGKKQLAAFKYCSRIGQLRTAVDVGGHVGLWSFNLAHDFRHVHAFEPVAAHRECFMKNTEGMEGRGSITLHALALGREPGSISITTEKGSSGNSFVGGAGDIPMVTLDSLDLVEVDFMKLDCEGSEENVLRGAITTINRCGPVIIVEQKRNFSSMRFGLKDQGAVDFLKTLGYVVAEEISGDYIMVPR